MSTQYLTLAQARAELGVSAFLFRKNFRPQLTEYRRGERTVLFDPVEVRAMKAESDGMWNKKKVSDALDHAWETRWKHARGAFKKESLKDKVDEERGSTALSHVDYNWLDAYVAELRDRDLAEATIKSRLSCLSTALKLAAKKGWIKAVPELPEVGQSNRRIRYLLDSPDEEALLHAACGCLRYQDCDVMRHVIVFLLDTGCRVSDLVKVRWKHVAHGRVVFEKQKNDTNHSVKLTDRAQAAIDALLEDGHWLHRVRGADKSDSRCRTAQNWLTHSFAKVRDEAGLKDVTLHTLRHTTAARLVQAGVSLYDVKDILNHSTISVTERYAHLGPTTSDRAIDVLNRRAIPGKVRSIR